jgi:hypothetical protein
LSSSRREWIFGASNSNSGCGPLKLDTLRVRQAKASALAGNAGYAPSPVRSVNAVKNAPVAGTGKHAVAGEDRRRSQRVLLRVRANIFVALQGKPAAFEVITLSVNHHGALVVMAQNLPLDTRLVLEHAGTKERVACKVARAAREMPEGFHVPIEFDSPTPDFWRIAFPPADWRADDQ